MMRTALILALALLAAAPAMARRAPGAVYRGVPRAALIAAAKSAPVKLVDNLEVYCDGDVSIEVWLRRLTAPEVRGATWSAGKCELVNDLNPSDAGGDYCVQASLVLKRPRGRDDAPEIEIYLESPKAGRPGEIYAFRGEMVTPDGPDYSRARKDFEADWRARFPNAPPPPCKDAD
jgi:hypothetical protein